MTTDPRQQHSSDVPVVGDDVRMRNTRAYRTHGTRHLYRRSAAEGPHVCRDCFFRQSHEIHTLTDAEPDNRYGD